ncbi:ABC transporter permease [Gluconacetobacter sp. Hr-1-5]|uniref:ABC transporter permease n=1 Tax=Gluconacetobacter sp. Hr-1-5 TaxID=3395370 RepID=UPI003B52B5C1
MNIALIFKAFLRQMRGHRLYTAINVAGLALGLATCITLGLIVRYEFTYDRWLPGADTLYRVDEVEVIGGSPAERALAPFVLFDPLKAAFPEIAHMTRVRLDAVTVITASDVLSVDATYVDPDFLQTLPYPLIYGDARTALSRPGQVVLSEEKARAYFHTTDAVGRTLTVDHAGRKTDLLVTGILRALPANTTLQPGMLIPLDSAMLGSAVFTQWGMTGGYLFLRGHDPAEARRLQAAMPGFLAAHVPGEIRKSGMMRDLRLRSLPSLHFLDGKIGESTASRHAVLALGLIGLLALLSAVINTVNLSTARGLLRAREVAMRKTLGASRRDLVAQFLGETLLLAACAAIPALALVELALPAVNALGGWGAAISYPLVLPGLAVLTLLVGLLAGAYPALWLSAYQPAAVLAASRLPGMGRRGAFVRLALVVVQFSFAIGLSVSTVVVLRQSAFVRDLDRGFERNGLLFTPVIDHVGTPSAREALMDAFRTVPGVTAVSDFYAMPGNSGFLTHDNFARVKAPDHHGYMQWQDVGRDYFRLFGLHLLAGRLFDDAHGEDDRQHESAEHSALIDASSARALGFATPQDALGQVLRKDHGNHALWRVIGVVNDVRLGSARDAVQPSVYFYTSEPVSFMSAGIRFAGRAERDVEADLRTIWRRTAPDVAFRPLRATDLLSNDYRDDEKRGRLLAAGAGVAIFIALMGLYALSSFTVARRMFEVGIRKTLGATMGHVLGLLIGQFLRPVLGAGLIGCALAWMAMRSWLAGFDARIALSPAYFAGVVIMAVLVAALTVLSQTLRVARAEPARALRAE